MMAGVFAAILAFLVGLIVLFKTLTRLIKAFTDLVSAVRRLRRALRK
ncbi:MAG: hypothetical protein LKI92_01955 [Schleiferilactobacillus harbinensis]|jgi:hypothetical protein|nr:hypothetical protein [Schleiferilactobacillus harbinensis]MCI1913476.1 hypothetical protein [Schleiferilactobacillus harbinensis]